METLDHADLDSDINTLQVCTASDFPTTTSQVERNKDTRDFYNLIAQSLRRQLLTNREWKTSDIMKAVFNDVSRHKRAESFLVFRACFSDFVLFRCAFCSLSLDSSYQSWGVSYAYLAALSRPNLMDYQNTLNNIASLCRDIISKKREITVDKLFDSLQFTLDTMPVFSDVTDEERKEVYTMVILASMIRNTKYFLFDKTEEIIRCRAGKESSPKSFTSQLPRRDLTSVSRDSELPLPQTRPDKIISNAIQSSPQVRNQHTTVGSHVNFR